MRQYVHEKEISVKDAAKSGRPMTVTGRANVSNVGEIMKNDCWYPMCDIAFNFEAYCERKISDR